ncbi:transmembrane protein 145-like [Chiloscyllium punctatum]|uniref:transmembrane protein 145-like n=1 Tax=Chiloscyllium punctatum TaxID=137246 RepID=UPI003B6393BF
MAPPSSEAVWPMGMRLWTSFNQSKSTLTQQTSPNKVKAAMEQIRLQFRICHKQEESLIVLRIFVVHKLELVKIIKLHTKVLKWVFLTKFCFLSEKGQISYHFRYPKAKHIVNLLFYYDEVTQWPSVYKNSSKDCWSKEAVAANGNSQLLNLTQSFLLSGCQLVETNGINYTDCQRRLNVHSARERWWFLAISNCKGGGITMEYTITMSNGKTLWRRHFSANQIGKDVQSSFSL